MERTEQGLKHQHVKTLAEVKLHNQRDKLIRHNDAIATAHAREDFMIALPLRILNRLRIEHQRPLFENLLDAHQEAYLLGGLIHHQFLLLIQRQHPAFTARLFGKPAELAQHLVQRLTLTVITAPCRAKLKIQRLIMPAELFVVEDGDHMV